MLMKQDVAKAALRAAHDQPAAVAAAMAMNDASVNRRRGRMMLPAPQVTACTPWSLATCASHMPSAVRMGFEVWAK